MITFLTTVDYQYTVKDLRDVEGPEALICRAMSYDDLFAATELQPGSYVFTDLERLSAFELQAAAEIFRLALRAPNVRCFNDPARAKTRFGLLRALREAGLNDFDVYAAEGRPRPKKFPVFVRDAANHGSSLTPLLPSQAELDQALAELPAAGTPLNSLIVTEFCGEPFRGDVYRRWGAFRLGGAIHLDHVASEAQWMVKSGAPGLVDDEVYRADDTLVRENAFETELARVFAIAEIDYGRADFSIVGGRMQVYEINTNPNIGRLVPHPSPVRQASLEFARERMIRLLRAMDSPSEGPPAPIAAPEANGPLDESRRMRARLREARAGVQALRAERDEALAALTQERARIATMRRAFLWKVEETRKKVSKRLRRV